MLKPDYIANPIGIDKEIQLVQISLTDLNIVDICLGRAERVQNSENKTNPYIFIGNTDYAEILQNDTIKSHLFFLPDDESTIFSFPVCKQNVSVFVFKNNIQVSERESFIENICFNINEINPNFELKKITRGLIKALSEFEIQNQKVLVPFFVFRLDYTVNYTLQNC